MTIKQATESPRGRNNLRIRRVCEIARSKYSANRVAKSLSSSQLKSAVSYLQSAFTAAEAREGARNSQRRTADIKKLAAMMAKMSLKASDIADKNQESRQQNSEAIESW